MSALEQQVDLSTPVASPTTFPVPPEIEAAFSLAGKQAFIDGFTPTRDAVETAYYQKADLSTQPGQRARKFLGAMITPMLGRPMRDAEEFYQTYGRLMRWAWLSISLGSYNSELLAVQDPQTRLNLAQVNTMDITWRPVISHLSSLGSAPKTIVEIGTGRANSVVRLAQLFPDARIVSVTISAEQYEIARGIVKKLGLNNVEIRLGNIFDPAIHSDLIGQADGVGAIEVTGHFPYERKAEGIGIFASLLKPGGYMVLADTALVAPISESEVKYYNNQCWYFGDRGLYEAACQGAGLEFTSYVEDRATMPHTLEDSAVVLAKHRPKLRQDFGWLMAQLWPMTPKMQIKTTEKVAYVYVIARK
jgi:cyclopropane fatty-acyl-phospholipid synthase-like methyltransferase